MIEKGRFSYDSLFDWVLIMATIIFTALVCVGGAYYMYHEYGLIDAIFTLIAMPLAIIALFYIESQFTYKAILLIAISFLAYAAKMEFFDAEEDY